MSLRVLACLRLRATIVATIILALLCPLAPVEAQRARARGGADVRASTARRTDLNNGALPPTDDFADLTLDESALDAESWLDPQRSTALRNRALLIAQERRARWPQFPAPREEVADELGIRRVTVGRITLHTDLPKSRDTDQIPEALEAAVPALCEFFKVSPSRFASLKVDAFLMADVDRFIEYGALDGPPQFLYGYSYGDRIYAKDQKLGYYNRFLLTHELTHTIMHELFGDLRPRWFSEGAAEFLALHAWNPQTKTMEIAKIPEAEELTPGFGRLRLIRELVGEGDALTIRDILEFEPRDYTKVSTYAWSWALVMFLYSSPKYRDVVELLPYWMTALDPNQLFIDAIGDRWGELEFDWANFVTTLDYQYNFDASAVVRATPREYTEEELKRGVVFEIEPNKGWQSVGVTLEKGKKYRVATAGRFLFYLPCAGKTLEFEAPGATCQYISGAPAGRLLAAVAQDVEGLTFSDVYGTEASALGATNRTFQFDAFRGQTSNVARFGDVLDPLYPWNEPIQFRSSYVLIAPERDGELYLRVNGASRDLEKNRGSIKIQVKLKD